ncbi:DNA cytosine methyltransferase [Enterococcus faecalis]|uniref:DNA cytosine methyltransferase n=1 Tax=Enterococcus faecalis TaxID=1351 RepID=UPI00080A8E87|nr:DNA cytosine methyltransferase [Enterococcus faecalis]EGO5109663.1 DNA cytosine methyltransferase [Enterococcus faecalis]
MYRVIDLFAGAGGMSLGFTKEGFRIDVAVENNKWAKKTFLMNHSETKMYEDIRDIDFHEIIEKNDLKEIDVVIGGPPCQGFSNANRNRNTFLNNNNSLVKEFFRAIKQINPKLFVMENVQSILSEKHLFFLNKDDKNEISDLNLVIIEKSFRLLQHEENISLFKNNAYIFNSNTDIDKYKLPEDFLRKIRILSIKRDDVQRNYWEKNLRTLQNFYTDVFSANDKNPFFDFYLKKLEPAILMGKIEIFDTKLVEKILEVNSALRFIQTINQHKLVNVFDTEELAYTLYSYTVKEYLKKIVAKEYDLVSQVIDASHLGVPQRRKRFILVGLRKDLSLEVPEFDNLFENLKQRNDITIRNAIGDLASLPVSYDVDTAGIAQNSRIPLNHYSRQVRDSEVIYNHVCTQTRQVALSRFEKILPGQNFHNLKEVDKLSYSNPGKTQNTIYQRLDYDKQSGTVVNIRKSMWIHPELNRALTIREAARLQSFPDSYIFYGTKDSQYQQVGNAVPPLVARQIASLVRNVLNSIFGY